MEKMPAPVGSPALLWIALYLFSPAGMLAANLKSVISLNPPWNRIFTGENVTLTCNVNNSLEVEWLHNDSALQETTTTLSIVNASTQNSGDYNCRDKAGYWSEPVRLEIFSDWLLLQVYPEVVKLGEPFFLRCHSWKNWNAYKVIYYKDNNAIKYWYENHNVSFLNATFEDSGTYYCKGLIQKLPRISDPVMITVIDQDQQTQHSWLKYFIPSLVAILFAVDTGLLISTQQQLKLFLKMQRMRKGNRRLRPQPMPDS